VALRSGDADRSEVVAVVDLGSTAVRLLLARIMPNAGYHVLVVVCTRGVRDGILLRETFSGRG